MPLLSIIVPLYNEAGTICTVLEKLRTTPFTGGIDREIIVVNDASTDAGAAEVAEYRDAHPDLRLRLVSHEVNAGKGAAIHTGIREASGDYIIIQDADLEYDPADINLLLNPMLQGRADVVYGSRFIGGNPHRILFFWHSIGNKILTWTSNMFTNLNLTDMEIGYKLFKADILKSLPLEEKRFGFEPEVTARIARIPKIRIYEVGISYYGRTYDEGKKIHWRDGVRAIFAILKYNLFLPREKEARPDPPLLADRKAWIVPLLFMLVGLVLAFVAPGTSDEGDSIMHYLYARHAFTYHEHFFNHWAKPLYVLIAAPFAQAGFIGVKLMNLTFTTLMLLFTHRFARRAGLQQPWLAVLCTACMPQVLVLSLSGLTEPMFGFWMMLGFLWLSGGKYARALTWLSFLPFIRSEGLLIFAAVALYILLKKAWRYLPLLAVGHVVYGIAGMLAGKNFLWTLNENPYASLSSIYGNGTWNYFLEHLPDLIGKVLPYFLLLGMLYGAVQLCARFLFRQKSSMRDEELALVYACYVGYFIAHSLFWALGIFNSFGMLRVFLPVLPLAGFICARGILLLSQPIDKALRTRPIQWACIALVVGFLLSGSDYGYMWGRDFDLKADQKAQNRLAAYMKRNIPDYHRYTFYYEPTHLSMALNIDHFDTLQHRTIRNSFEDNRFPSRSFFIWDDWFSKYEGVDSARISSDPRFELLASFEERDPWNQRRVTKLFRKKD